MNKIQTNLKLKPKLLEEENTVYFNKSENGLSVGIKNPVISEDNADRGHSSYCNIYPFLSNIDSTVGHLIPFFICGIQNDCDMVISISLELNKEMTMIEKVLLEKLRNKENLYYIVDTSISKNILTITQRIFNSSGKLMFKSEYSEFGYVYSEMPIANKTIRECLAIKNGELSKANLLIKEITKLEKLLNEKIISKNEDELVNELKLFKNSKLNIREYIRDIESSYSLFISNYNFLKIEKSNFDMINEKYATETSVVKEKKITPKPVAPKPGAPKHNKDSFIKESISEKLLNKEIRKIGDFNGLSNIDKLTKFKNQLISLSPRNGKAVSEMFKLIVKFHNNKNDKARDELADFYKLKYSDKDFFKSVIYNMNQSNGVKYFNSFRFIFGDAMLKKTKEIIKLTK